MRVLTPAELDFLRDLVVINLRLAVWAEDMLKQGHDLHELQEMLKIAEQLAGDAWENSRD